MANINLTVRGSMFQTPVELRALFGNLNQVTQISERLAIQLGIMEKSREIYLSPGDGSIGGPFQFKFRISSFPMIITGLPPAVTQKAYAVYPLINTRNAFYEMIVGRDCFEQNFSIINHAVNDRKDFMQGLKPSPGPGYVEGRIYMGHNLMLTPYEEIPVVDEFLEFLVQGCRSVRRIALNRVTHQLIAVYAHSDAVYSYEQLPANLQIQLEDSRGAYADNVMVAVKEACVEQTIASFPDTVSVNPQNSVAC